MALGKLNVGILGATGAAGLEFVRALSDHPFFEIGELYASNRNSGKSLEEACALDTSEIPEYIRSRKIKKISNVDFGLDFVCSALPLNVARKIEEKCAEKIPVISTTSAFRYEEDVPIMITEVNFHHYGLLLKQKERGWKGWILPGPNCTTVGLVMSLYPIFREVGIRRVVMSSYQAISGGGYQLVKRWKAERKIELPKPIPDPGNPVENPEVVLEGNVIGYIENEEDKVKKESLKILGDYDGAIRPARFKIDCSCVRVPVLNSHFETVFVETEKSCSKGDIREFYEKFNGECRKMFGGLPSSPKDAVLAIERSPQPFFDSNLQGGMTTVVGRIEESKVYRNGIKYQVLSNNTEKGAAKGIVQSAEFLHKIGFL